ncbi:hypothetical protein GOHSU_43_00440 [Gordonia hirsuta DSM 44140 = NBRC 16056]|uniref:CBS domain-containing protein n=1 Tax=Gordonia hirsuta DSM 44140 = NBRC 16056 TaxID=1121927 RepID=L7LBU6_9ACTN|nr:CBS domain-containing protein [Gordonia hirsuta]GAC58600.1 hypothetical protein GOHSU_43_00440 [Gordonia hirsuta DSM 44140 = NBRC 16056]
MTAIPSAGSIVVADLIGGAVIRIPVGSTVAGAAKVMMDERVGVVVVGDEPRPEAVLSERDVVQVVAQGHDPESVPAPEVASTELVWCGDDETVDAVATRMTDRYIRHILVERDDALVGIISARDLLGVYAGDSDGARG